MNCNNIKLLFMDFLYDEISDNDKKLLKNHLIECVHCREEFEKLKKTSNVLQQWEDIDPNFNFTFVSEKKSVWASLIEKMKFSPKRMVYSFAAGLAAVLLIMSIANTEISYSDGRFSLKMSLIPQKGEQQKETINEELVARLQQQNVQLMNTLIQRSEERQRQQLISTLNQFSHDFDNRRTNDLQLVGAGLEEIERNIYSKIEKQTNNQFNNLIRYINTQQGK